MVKTEDSFLLQKNNERTKMNFRYLRSSFCLLLVVFFATSPAVAQSERDDPVGLFQDAGEARSKAMSKVGQRRMETLKEEPTTQSIRLVRIARHLSQRRALTIRAGRGQALAPDVRPVFEREQTEYEQAKPSQKERSRAVEFRIQRDEIDPIAEGRYAWKGIVKGGPGKNENVGDVTLVRGSDGEVTGTIRIGSEYFLVRPLSRGAHALVRVDESQYPKGGKGARYAGGEASTMDGSGESGLDLASSAERTCSASTVSFGATSSGSVDTPVIESADSPVIAETETQSAKAACPENSIDVLAVYTYEAANGRNMSNLIDLAIQESNDAYDNSNIYSVDLDLAHSQQIAFSRGFSMQRDLNQLKSNSTVQSLRNQYNADVVVLLTDVAYGGAAGLADEIRAEAGDAYAIVAAPYATGGNYTFAHEIGHLQGGQHHPNDPTCTPGTSCDDEGDLFNDAFGHRFVDGCSWWNPFCSEDYYATVMAYTPGSYSRVKHFSNPNVQKDGQDTGTNSRDNASALSTTFSTVKGFRTDNTLRARASVSGRTGSQRTLSANPCGGTGSYSYEWRISYNGPGNYGSVVSTSKSTTQYFPEGTHYAKVTVTSGGQTDTAIRSVFVSCDPNSRLPCLKRTAAKKNGEKETSAKRNDGPVSEVALHTPAPNPTTSTAQIAYELPERTDVTLTVYDLMGRQVKQLASGILSEGTHRARLDGSSLSSGTYVVRLRAGGKMETRRITIVE